MNVAQTTVDYGLLSELAYLRLENYTGNYNNLKDLTDFINDKSEDETGIDPERKQVIINLLNKYEILDFKDTNETGGTQSGMQAMFVREKATGKKVLLFRGTEANFDSETTKDLLYADGYMALGGSSQQMIDARNYANMLKNSGISGDKLDNNTVVTGHSLGGSLSQLIAYEHGLEAHNYNPFGIANNFVISSISGDASRINNYVQGIDFVSSGGTLLSYFALGQYKDFINSTFDTYTEKLQNAHLGEVNTFIKFYEDGYLGIPGLGTSHSITGFTQTIEIYNNYLTDLFATNDLNVINEKIATYAGIENIGIENTGISRLAQLTARAMGRSLLDNFDYNDYAAVETIFADAWEKSAGNGFRDLTLYNADELANLSKNLNAILYASMNNTFITLNNEDYFEYKKLDDLNYSDEQKEDRGRFLYYRANPQSKISGDGILYTDMNTNFTAFDKAAAINRITFGTEVNDEINGSLGDDTLYGNGGDDTISGDAGNDTIFAGKGNDTLVGGAGDDSYHIESSGHDTINDSVGHITISLINLVESVTDISLTDEGNDLVLHRHNGSIKIQNFDNNFDNNSNNEGALVILGSDFGTYI